MIRAANSEKQRHLALDSRQSPASAQGHAKSPQAIMTRHDNGAYRWPPSLRFAAPTCAHVTYQPIRPILAMGSSAPSPALPARSATGRSSSNYRRSTHSMPSNKDSSRRSPPQTRIAVLGLDFARDRMP